MDFVVLLVLPLLKALLAFLATLLDVLAIVESFSCKGGTRTPDLRVIGIT